MRGSSMPQISSGYLSPSGNRVGSPSICQSSTPFTERAAHKCDSPRRSSTRQSNSVEPSGRSVAPALNTLLIEYGQSFPVRIGLPVCRSNKVSYWTIMAFMEYLLHSWEGFPNFASAADRPLRPSDPFPGTVEFFHLTHFQKCHQEGQSRFSPLVFISPVRM